MGVAALFAVVVAGGLVSQVIWHLGACHLRRAGERRRAAALRHLDDITRQVQGLKRPDHLTQKWQASSYRRYYVPAGLHLEQARRVLREAQERAAEGSTLQSP
ncbi:MAG TPA: hypothetical protein VFO27_14105 [Bryobacteraceae bacterium]|nr:hypothetical protein [Bryobacteraceae bacterium]